MNAAEVPEAPRWPHISNSYTDTCVFCGTRWEDLIRAGISGDDCPQSIVFHRALVRQRADQDARDIAEATEAARGDH